MCVCSICVCVCNMCVFVCVAFSRFDDSNVDVTKPKVLFVLINLAGMAMGLYKLYVLGLLPTGEAAFEGAHFKIVCVMCVCML